MLGDSRSIDVTTQTAAIDMKWSRVNIGRRLRPEAKNTATEGEEHSAEPGTIVSRSKHLHRRVLQSNESESETSDQSNEVQSKHAPQML